MKNEQLTYSAALGWFDLGAYVDAFNELDNLPPKHRASVQAMELRCRIYRKLEKWRELEMVAEGRFVRKLINSRSRGKRICEEALVTPSVTSELKACNFW